MPDRPYGRTKTRISSAGVPVTSSAAASSSDAVEWDGGAIENYGYLTVTRSTLIVAWALSASSEPS